MESTTDADTLLLSVIEHFDDDEEQDQVDDLGLSQTRSFKTPRGSVTRLHLTPVSLSLTTSGLTRKEESSIDINTISEEKADANAEALETGRAHSSSKHSLTHSRSRSFSYTSDDFETASTSHPVIEERLIKLKLRVLKQKQRNDRIDGSRVQLPKAERDKLQRICEHKIKVLQRNLKKGNNPEVKKNQVVYQRHGSTVARPAEPATVKISHHVEERLKIEKCMFQLRSVSSKLSDEIEKYEKKQEQTAARRAELELNEFARRKARQLREQLRAQNVVDSDLQLQQARFADLQMREVGRLMRTVSYLSQPENAKLVWQKLLKPVL